MFLKPKTIEPGWAKRWSGQSVDLFRRSPGLALSVVGAFVLSNSFIPQPIELNVPVTVFLVGLLFSSLRAADHDSGNAWSATWHYYRMAIRDLAQLARDAFLWMLVFGMAFAVFFALYESATRGLGVHHSDKLLEEYRDLPWWLRQGVSQANSMDLLGIFLPGAIPVIFLTMSVGNQLLLHFQTGFRAAVLNMVMTYAITVTGMVSCSLLSPVLREAPSALLGYGLLALYAAVFWWFGTWGYLWCREMFEGDTENAKQTARKTVSLTVASGA